MAFSVNHDRRDEFDDTSVLAAEPILVNDLINFGAGNLQHSLFASTNGGGFLHAQHHYSWAHPIYCDLTDPVVRAKLKPAGVGELGEGLLGIPPQFFVCDTAYGHEQGLAQLGSGGDFSLSGPIVDV